MATPVNQHDFISEDEPRRTSRWGAVKFAIKAIEIRLRFIAILVGIGLMIGYWDTLRNYWDKWTRPADATAAGTAADEEFYCPMHPSVVRDDLEPDGSVPKCPICGMPLSKHKKGAPPDLSPGVVGRVQLSPERVQLAGIKTVEVAYEPLMKEIRTVGYVDYDESRQSNIVARVNGYVEKLHVDKTFQTVAVDEPLADLYSPALYSASQELLLASKRNLGSLTSSAREKLRLLGVGDQEVDQMVSSGEANSRVVIRSPQHGHVIAKHVVEGSRIEEGMTLFEVADLSVVWIEAEVFEKDVMFLEAGQSIEASVDTYPNRVFAGTVSLVHPHVEKATRTNRVRFELANPNHELRPGMYAAVQIRRPMAEIEPFASQIASRSEPPVGGDLDSLAKWQQTCPVTGAKLGSMGTPVEVTLGDQTALLCCAGCVERIQESPERYLNKLAPPPKDQVLTVPQSAVIDTGSMQVVYVEREPGVYEGVEVVLGPRSNDHYPVVTGLLPGDRIAAAGAFLIDAETRLNPAAASSYFGASGSPHAEHAPPAAAPSRAPNQPSRSSPAMPPLALKPEHLREISKLDPADQTKARQQLVCPVTDEPLGSMGVPIKLTVDGREVFVCCKGCEGQVRSDPAGTLRKIDSAASSAGTTVK